MERDDNKSLSGHCYYCKKSCWLPVNVKRFDGAEWVATCPQGKVMDTACNEIAEAYENVSRRKL